MTNSEAKCKCTYNETGCGDCEWTKLISENTKLKAEVEQFSNELISVLIENELLKKKNELTNYYFEQYAAAIDEIEQLKRLSDQQSELNIEQFKQIDNQYQEIEQLKSKLEQSVNEKAEVISKIEYALNECEPIYNGCAFIPQAQPIYDLAMNYCLDLLKGKVEND